MMQFDKQLKILILFALILSCAEAEKRPPNYPSDKTIVKSKGEYYLLNSSEVEVYWTAYKFSEKVGVSGSFDQIEVDSKGKAQSIDNLLKDSKVMINTASINSNNEIRDSKLRTYFFKELNTDTIKGEIIDATEGKGTLALEMNNMIKHVKYSYVLKNDTLLVSVVVNLTLWNGEEALDVLNKECLELHTGVDGVSKLWPDITIAIKLPLKKVQAE